MQLSVLSALAGVMFDPWEEAALWRQCLRQLLRRRCVWTIDQVSGRNWTHRKRRQQLRGWFSFFRGGAATRSLCRRIPQ